MSDWAFASEPTTIGTSPAQSDAIHDSAPKRNTPGWATSSGAVKVVSGVPALSASVPPAIAAASLPTCCAVAQRVAPPSRAMPRPAIFSSGTAATPPST